jgi:hypothetical protein
MYIEKRTEKVNGDIFFSTLVVIWHIYKTASMQAFLQEQRQIGFLLFPAFSGIDGILTDGSCT